MVSTASPPVYPHLWVCMGDDRQAGLVPVLSVRSAPKRASSHHVVPPQIPIRRKWFPALDLVRNPNSIQRAGDRVEKRLVLVHLRPGSAAEAGVSVHVDCIAVGAPHCYVILNPHKASVFQYPRNIYAGMTRSEFVGRARRHAVPHAPCKFLCRALAKTFPLPPLPRAGHPVPAGVLFPAAGPTKLCARLAGPS